MRPLAVVAAFALLLGACSKGAGKEATDAAKHVSNAVQTAASDVANAVKPKDVVLRNIAYDPQRLTVKVDEEVRWTNRDGFPHTVTSDNESFNSGDLGTDKTYSFRFTHRGTYPYHCTIHGKNRMSGTIVVN